MASRSRRISLREQLRVLLRRHPDWTNAQYAQHLGQKPSTIRGAISAMRKTGYLEPLPVVKEKKTRPKKVSTTKPVIDRQKLDRRVLTSRAVGYLKLI